MKKPERLTHRFGAVLKRLGLCGMAYHLRSSLLWMTVLQLDLMQRVLKLTIFLISVDIENDDNEYPLKIPTPSFTLLSYALRPL